MPPISAPRMAKTPAAGTLLPDSHGRIRHVALQAGNVEFDQELPPEVRSSLYGIYAQLFEALPGARFTLVTANRDHALECEDWLAERKLSARGQVVQLGEDKRLSIWARDSLVPTRDRAGRGRILVQDRSYWPGADDRELGGALARATPNTSAIATPWLRLDQGNLLSNPRDVFIGHDSLAQTAEALRDHSARYGEERLFGFFERQTGRRIATGRPEAGEISKNQVWEPLARTVFSQVFGKTPVIAGPTDREQDVFHIDMMMTPIGSQTVLVGDPRETVGWLKELTPQQRRETARTVAARSGLPYRPELIDQLIAANDDSKLAGFCDTVAAQAKARYEVIRVPYLSGVRRGGELPYITFNNCLQEVYREPDGRQIKRVLLPQYGIEALDRRAKEIYRGQGFSIEPIDVAAITVLEGALRCCTNVVERQLRP